uniref:Decapping mRNA 1B n=1 Tax=Oncorhynchus tshawytscha TaxID=74940 RepID=A0AAZ3ST39_ONCTS
MYENGVLNTNPSLIKPIPVKPMERYPQPGLQERPPRPLSLATLFGVQQPRAELVSPMAGSGGPGSQPQGKPGGVRPAVARSLSYDDPVQAQLHLQAQEGGLFSGSSPPQHCPAFQKLMKDAASSQLQPVSESPENRLHENGAPSVLHHQTQARQDPIQRLFQNQPTSTTPSMTTSAPCCPRPPPLIPGHPQPGQLTGVVSPHELLQRLQLVQQEQSLVPEPTRPSSNLAPRFHEPVISPQRIPATVAPTLLLSPSVFSQAKRPQAPDDPQPRGLSKSQLQATLLHLIQNDSSFLDTIYESYAQRFSTDATANKF